MVSKKLAVGGQSSNLEQRLAELQAEIEGKAPPAVVAAKGFVPRTEETEREKEEARSAWDRAQLLQVGEDDAQVKIYNDLARGPNNGGERPTRFGLGFGDGGPRAAHTGPVKVVGTMRFVASASASAATPDAPPAGGAAAAAPSGAQPAPEWTGPHATPEGNQYWYNVATKQSQWTPPDAAPPAAPAAPAPAAQPEWTGPHATPDGQHRYWYNTRTRQSEWVQPAGCAPPAAPAAPAPARKPGCTLLLGGIPPDLQDADVRELFGTYGAVTELVLDRGSYSAGAGPKRGHVCYDGAVGAAAAAKALHGKQMRQYALSVTHAEAAAAAPAPTPAAAAGCYYPPQACAPPAGAMRGPPAYYGGYQQPQYYPAQGAAPGHRYQPY